MLILLSSCHHSFHTGLSMHRCREGVHLISSDKVNLVRIHIDLYELRAKTPYGYLIVINKVSTKLINKGELESVIL